MKRSLCVLFALLAISALAQGQKPAINANGVQDSASNTVNVAQGGVFVVKGSNLCAQGLKYGAVPYPATLDGVKITFTPAAGGTSTDAFMVYNYAQGAAAQLSGILPSTVAPGTYNVTVTNNGQVSDPVRATVVARKFSIITVDSSGTGRAVAQNYISAAQLDLNRFTTGTLGSYTMSPAKPGQTLILWGTGLGAITKPDNAAPGAIDFSGQVAVRVIVGDATITPFYAGRAPELPGADQIDFTLPANVQTGCNVPLQVSVGGQLSNPTTIAVAPASAGACAHPQFNAATLAKLDQGQTMVSGSFGLASFAISTTLAGTTVDAKTESFTGAFARYSADQMGDASGFINTIDSCQVYRRTGNQNALLVGSSSSTLDAGANLTLAGPAGFNKQVPRGTGNVYTLSLGTVIGGLPSLPGGISIPGLGGSAAVVPGTFTLTGTGGADVGAFRASLNVGNPLAVGALSDTVPRSQALTVRWTGGGATDLVAIAGTSGTVVSGAGSDNPIYDAGVFVCTTTANKGSFTVPASVLSQLPATPPGGIASGNGIGVLLVISTTQPTSNSGLFTAPLVAGGSVDNGVFLSTVGTLKTVTYQ